MTIECEFGCECDAVADSQTYSTVLGPEDLQRLIQEKLARAQHYIELQDRSNRQFKTD
jgi:hypothetical protein